MRPGGRLTTTVVLAILVTAAMVSSFYLSLAGRRLRPEHVAAPVAFLVFAVSQLARRERIVRIDAFSGLAVAWVLVNAIASWLFAPQPSVSLVHVVRHGLLVTIFLTVANLAPLQADSWRSRLRLYLGLGVVELAYGIVAWWLAWYSDVWPPGVYLERGLSGISVQGTQLERNLFGILAATLLAVSFYALAARSRQQASRGWKVFLVVACLVSGSALALSLTRSAWMAVVLAAPLAYVFFDRRRLRAADGPLLQTVVGVPVLVAALIGMLGIVPASPAAGARDFVPSNRPAVSSPGGPNAVLFGISRPAAPAIAVAPEPGISNRVQTLGRLKSDFTVATRMQDAQWALNDWLKSPLLGHGTGSFSQLHGIRVGTEAWLSNLVLHTMVDTGIVGLAIQFALFVMISVLTWRAARNSTDPGLAAGLRALTLGFLVIAAAYQLTDGSWMAVMWIHLGLMVNGIYCVRAEQRHEAGTLAPAEGHA